MKQKGKHIQRLEAKLKAQKEEIEYWKAVIRYLLARSGSEVYKSETVTKDAFKARPGS